MAHVIPYMPKSALSDNLNILINLTLVRNADNFEGKCSGGKCEKHKNIWLRCRAVVHTLFVTYRVPAYLLPVGTCLRLVLRGPKQKKIKLRFESKSGFAHH